MKNHIKDYTNHLEKAIGEYMERPVSERSAEAVDGMTQCWKHLKEAEKMMECTMSAEDAKAWAESMINSDGTTKAHWDMATTTAVAKENGVMFDHISEWCWWTAMNMMYSDYYKTADKHGVDIPEFYADLAKDFLFDADGKPPKEKLADYYCYVVKHD